MAPDVVQQLVDEAAARDEVPEDWTLGYDFPPPEATMPEAPTPKRRSLRTLLQVLVGTAAAVPVAWKALTDAGVVVDPKIAALVLGVPAAFVVLASVAQNLWDASKGKG